MTYRARKNLVVTITALLLAAMVISLVSSAVLAQSDPDCGMGPGGSFGCENGGGGGENPPDDGGGGGGRDPDDGGGGGSGSDGGGGSGGDGGGGDVGSDDSVPTPQPTPVPWYETVTFYCTTWPTCPEGWANVVGQRNPAGRFYANDVTCLTEDDCISSDDGSDDDDDFPCDYPPTIEGGIIHQPCDEWPGWFIEAEVTIPPARVLRHPWPRGLVNWPNEYWFAGTAPEPEAWSNKAKECPAASAGDTSDSGTFDCNGGVGSATQGAKVNYQIGVAWRRWTPGDGDIFGYSPPDHVSWTIQDRDGSHMLFGPHVSYTFETSSWGQPRRGPVWNEECQDRECGYDERVASPTGSPAYPVGVTTYWYPEWNIRWLEYECNREDCDCTCVTGSGSDQCSGPSGHCILDNEYWKQDCECVEWKWNRTSDGWTTYDLRPLGLDPVIPWNAAVTAGADENGHRQGSWIDAQPWTPIIEVQPVGAHTGDE